MEAMPSLCFNEIFYCAEEWPSLKPSIEEPRALELKPFPNHIQYAYLKINKTLAVIISSKLYKTKKINYWVF